MLRLKSSRTETGATPSIDMTPMIDMVFQLLIFFMLTSIFASQPVLEMVLPSADHTKTHDPEGPIRLAIQKEGRIFVDQEEVPMRGLRSALTRRMEEGRKKAVLLSADQDVPFQAFVNVLDVTRDMGLLDLAIVTRKPESNRGENDE